MVEWFHGQSSPIECAQLHVLGMRSFSVSGKDVNRWLLHLTAPGFVRSVHLSNPASLGNNKIDNLMIRDIYIYIYVYNLFKYFHHVKYRIYICNILILGICGCITSPIVCLFVVFYMVMVLQGWPIPEY